MSRENVEVVRASMDAAQRGDVDALLDLLDADIEFIPLRAATEGTYRGHEGIKRFLADTEESFELFEPHYELRDLGGQVLAWGTIRVRGRGGGVEMDVPTGGVFAIRDGKIVRWQDFGSRETALEAVGLRE